MRLLLLVLRDGCGAGECVFLDYPLTQRLRSSRRVRLRRGVSPRRPLEEFPVLGVHALFARQDERTEMVDDNGHAWVRLDTARSSYWQNLDTGYTQWRPPWEHGGASADRWILREMAWSMGAMLGSTVDAGFVLVLGFWTNFTQFLRFRGLGS